MMLDFLAEFCYSLGPFLAFSYAILSRYGQPFLCTSVCEGEGTWIDALSRVSPYAGHVMGDSVTGDDSALMRSSKHVSGNNYAQTNVCQTPKFTSLGRYGDG